MPEKERKKMVRKKGRKEMNGKEKERKKNRNKRKV
jgi:hypothetical protein